MAALVILLVATGCTRTVAGQTEAANPFPGPTFSFKVNNRTTAKSSMLRRRRH